MSARRLAFLIDGEAYFSAFAEAARRAERSIFILGWDVHSRTRLYANGTLPDELGAFLNELVSRRRGLRVYVLDWDFAMIYALERETLPVFRLDWRTHRRFRFQLDGEHPIGASHHQKIVVIDDAIAFVGGLDLTINRWDTPEHRVEEPRRIKPNGTAYGPFHDVQVAVDADAAAALGVLARERWHRATGRRLRPKRALGDPWPPDLVPSVTDVRVAIARTAPAFDDRPEIREVERLYLDTIAAAKRFIYIENQYITSAALAAALEARLREVDAPEVVMVTTRECSGWLEEETMGALRARLVQRLRAADGGDRLRVYCAVIRQPDCVPINVHDKIMIADDVLARVGSANLSNRSFGLDTECDLAIASEGEPRIEGAIARFRHQLMAEHLDQPIERVAQVMRTTGSLIRTIESLRGSGRTLEPLEVKTWAADDTTMFVGTHLADPEGPMDAQALTNELFPDEVVRAPHHPLLRAAVVVVPLLALAAAWRYTPLGAWINPSTVRGYLDGARDLPFAILWVALAYVIAGLVLFPLTVLIASTAFVFGGLVGSAYALVGALASAAVTYGIGRLLGRDFVRRIGGRRLNRLSRRLMRRGVTVGIVPHIVPMAPFTIVNLAAGAARVPAVRYFVGTTIGLLPGLGFLGLVGSGLGHALFESGLVWWLILVALAALTVGGALWLRRRQRGGSADVQAAAGQ